MTERLNEALRGLSQTLREIESLSAWLELERSERSESFDHSFQWNSSTVQDLKVRIGAFLSLYWDILEIMRDRHFPAKTVVETRLQTLCKRFNELASGIHL